MKALILANIGTSHFYNGEMLPSCFLPLYNSMTVIERQISLLNINGIDNDKICVLCGKEGVWELERIRKRLDGLGVKLIFTDQNDVLKGHMLDDDFFQDDFLIIEGNLVFDIAVISRLKRYRPKNVMVIKERIHPDGGGRGLVLVGSRVAAIKNAETAPFPWNVFAGIVKLSNDAMEQMKRKTIYSRSLLESMNDILADCDVKAIKYDDLIYGTLNGGYSSELTGGSYSKLNYRLVVKKESDNEGREKLINEIEWLLSLPDELKSYFSEVLEYDISSKKVFYNVPYYGSRNLREHIFDGHLDADTACAFLEKLMDFMFKNVYSRKIRDTPDGWVMEKHINRVLDRLPKCSEKAPELGKIINAEKVVINGMEYRNVKELFTSLSCKDALIKKLTPKELVMIHGDLHFQNILLYHGTDRGFMLVDPRGESLGSDIYYDLGKLWHSFHAKYDFIHSDQFKYEISWKDGIPIANYSITNAFSERVYDEIFHKFPSVITKYDIIRSDPDWEMKVLFAEAAHLCSVSIFHIHKTKTPERAIVMYLTGVKLINEFFAKYIDE